MCSPRPTTKRPRPCSRSWSMGASRTSSRSPTTRGMVRGYVQLTWEDNYKKQDEKLGLRGTLLETPDLALNPEIAKQVIIYGMADGDFTGKRLGKFFTADQTDWYNARTIVNGHDRADDIAAYAEMFHNAIGWV